MFTAIYGANKATNLTTNLTKKKKQKLSTALLSL